MDILKKFLFSVFPVALLTGCYTDFNPDQYSEPVLCLNSVITAGEPVTVSVLHTWRYNDNEGYDNHEVKDAVVSIYANGELIGSDYLAKEGDEIRIIAVSERYGSAEASVKVPLATPIVKAEFIPSAVIASTEGPDRFTADLRFSFQVRLTIPDRDTDTNYFRLAYNPFYDEWTEDEGHDYIDPYEEYNGPSSYFSPGTMDYNSDPIFREHIGIVESMLGGYEDLWLFFTDRMFSGKDYTLTLRFDDAWFRTDAPEFEDDLFDSGITFGLMSVSRSYYDRMNYLWQKNSGMIGELSDIGLADPVWGYSNVSTGAGIVVARTLTTYELNLKDFLIGSLDKSESIQVREVQMEGEASVQ